MTTTTPILPSRIPAFVFALFEGSEGASAGSGEGASGAAGGGAPSGAAAAATGVSGDGGRASGASDVGTARNQRGQFESTADYERRISELKQENVDRRRENKELKTSQEALATQISTANQRVIRSEARDALRDANVINPRIVDIFLSDLGDKVKIDPKTGEPVGILENLEAWKTANPDFFKAAAAAGSGSAAGGGAADGGAAGSAGGTGSSAGQGAGDGGTGENRANRTGSGSSLAGGAAEGDGTVAGLPDLRKLNRDERKAAMARYENSLRVGGRR